jgi:hypothetical protein
MSSHQYYGEMYLDLISEIQDIVVEGDKEKLVVIDILKYVKNNFNKISDLMCYLKQKETFLKKSQETLSSFLVDFLENEKEEKNDKISYPDLINKSWTKE